MKLSTFFKQLIKSEQGFVLVLISLAMSVILGFTALITDFGLLALNKNRLVNACDAAALAGATQLPNSAEAIETAMLYAGNNGITSNLAINITNNNKIQVSAQKEVPLVFARILGISSGIVKTKSSAQYAGVKSIIGVAPLAIPDKPYQFAVEYLLKISSDDPNILGPGNYGALSLGGSGSDRYRESLKYGYQERLEVGDIVNTETGNISGPTKDGVEYRLSKCYEDCTPTDFQFDCPKILYIPIYLPPTDTSQQVKQVTIVGFAAFMLSNIPGNGNDSQIKGCFLKTIPPDQMNPVTDPSQPVTYGLAGAKLTE